jgi:Flp pilus assembly pilin Flp
MKTWIHRLLVGDDAQDLIEYALLCTFVALACVLGVTALSNAVSALFSVIATQLAND